MENQIALAALGRRRAEKAGRITQLKRETKKQVKALQSEIRNLDAVIRDMSEGEIDPELIPARRRFPKQSEDRGALTRVIYDVLRPLPKGEAVSARRFVDEFMGRKGLDPEVDRDFRNNLVNVCLNQLRAMSLRGVIEKVGRGQGVLWRLPKIHIEDAAG
jgi:hypothetical protein